MKIVFYSPYIPQHFGGGEKYLLDTALVYAQKHEVFIALPCTAAKADLNAVKSDYEKHFGYDLKSVEFIHSPLGSNKKRWRKAHFTHKFDVVYYVTDGSAFWARGRYKNIMHIQVPLPLPRKKGFEKWKFKRFQVINTNSHFTKKIVEKFWGVDVNLVCQPGIDTVKLAQNEMRKDKIILNVGRFFDNLHTKNQLLMVEVFAKLIDKNPELLAGWQLVLIGNVESESYLAAVREAARGLPVKILTNCSPERLAEYQARAAIYWHATGFYDDENAHPEKMEHFGIATVEAMAAGAVPVVIAKGGQKEILGQKLRPCGWLTIKECLQVTTKMIKNDKLRQTMAAAAVKRAEFYSRRNFEKRVWQMLDKRP